MLSGGGDGARTIPSFRRHEVTEYRLVERECEGYELEALSGLDLSRHKPEYIIIETFKFGEVERVLQGDYRLVAVLSGYDYLFQRH